MTKTKIVIAGGGFGGLYAAKYFDKTLARRDDVEVTLISRENTHVHWSGKHRAALTGRVAPLVRTALASETAAAIFASELTSRRLKYD